MDVAVPELRVHYSSPVFLCVLLFGAGLCKFFCRLCVILLKNELWLVYIEKNYRSKLLLTTATFLIKKCRSFASRRICPCKTCSLNCTFDYNTIEMASINLFERSYTMYVIFILFFM